MTSPRCCCLLYICALCDITKGSDFRNCELFCSKHFLKSGRKKLKKWRTRLHTFLGSWLTVQMTEAVSGRSPIWSCCVELKGQITFGQIFRVYLHSCAYSFQPHRPVQVSMATELSAFDMPLCQMSSPTEKQDDVTASDINFTWLDEHCPSPRYQVVGHRSHCILTDISNECLLVQKFFVFFFLFSHCVKK